MAVDLNNARHICNVARRTVHSQFPELHIHFVLHGENQRAKSFSRDKHVIEEHPAGEKMTRHLLGAQSENILKRNKSQFVAISCHNKPGFLGFFKNDQYLAVCCVNYDRFSSKEHLRMHSYHMVWHALALFQDYKSQDDDKARLNLFNTIDGVLVPTLNTVQKCHRNLLADIFSCSVQMMLGKDNALDTLAKQRMTHTLTPETGFMAEKFPFPVCCDTLDFLFQNNISNYDKSKKAVLSAVKLTEDTGKTYDPSSIEQWHAFSAPAQIMAWSGHTPEEILGSALYTGEDAYVQSIADMISERLNIKPQAITHFQSYNPFTTQDVNTRTHQKLCKAAFDKSWKKASATMTADAFFNEAKAQNEQLKENQALGWCAPALIKAGETLEASASSSDEQERAQMKSIAWDSFANALAECPWDTVLAFNKKFFEMRRNGLDNTADNLIKLATSDQNAFAVIHDALTHSTLDNAGTSAEQDPDDSITQIPSQGQKKNITDFISENAIKK